jgi:hypothetical protein
MSSSALGAHKLRRIFCPRALIVAALIAHIALALMFWAVCLGLVVAIARLYPVLGFTCVLLFVTLAVALTGMAWRRNTWFVAILYLIGSVITLPWTVLFILHWFNPT